MSGVGREAIDHIYCLLGARPSGFAPSEFGWSSRRSIDGHRSCRASLSLLEWLAIIGPPVGAQTFKECRLERRPKSVQICDVVLHHAAALEVIARIGRRDDARIQQEYE